MPPPPRSVVKPQRDRERHPSRKSSAVPDPLLFDDEPQARRPSKPSRPSSRGGDLPGSYQEGGSSSSTAVRLVVFDFDQTLSTVHVFKSLAGWAEEKSSRRRVPEGRSHRKPETAGDEDDPDDDDTLLPRRGRKDVNGIGSVSGGLLRVPKPFASSERGQMRRISELDYVEPFNAAGFARWAFGGEARVAQVKALLEGLRERDVEVMVCTKGLVGAVRKCLHDLGLLCYFADIYGNVGSATYGSTRYDDAVNARPTDPDEERFLGQGDDAAWGTKDKLIANLMRRRRLRKEEAVLVEDDPEEIRKADRVCRTLFVREARGITAEHCEWLRRVSETPTAVTPGGSAFRAVEALGAHPRGPSPRPPLALGPFEANRDAADGRKSSDNLLRGPRARSPSHSRLASPAETPRSIGLGKVQPSSSIFTAAPRMQPGAPGSGPPGPLLPLPARPDVRIRSCSTPVSSSSPAHGTGSAGAMCMAPFGRPPLARAPRSFEAGRG